MTERRRWWALVVLLSAVFMELVDVGVVNIALPRIRSTLPATHVELQWIVASYSVGFALALIPSGMLGDRVGHRRIFAIGVLAFGTTSLLCALATNAQILITMRFLQGIAGALMLPQVLAMTNYMFEGSDRVRAFSLYGAVAGMASVTAPLVGALLLKTTVLSESWRTIFLINVAIAAITFVAVLLIVPEVRANSIGTMSSRTFRELLKIRSFRLGVFAAVTFFASLTGFFFVSTVFLQNALGYSPLHAAFTGIPYAVGTGLGSISAGYLTTRLQRRLLSVGAATMAIGTLGLVGIVNRSSAITTQRLAIPLFVGGFGMGLVVVTILDFTLAKVPPGISGLGSATANLTQPLGGVVGVVVMGGIYFASEKQGIHAFTLAMIGQCLLLFVLWLFIFALPKTKTSANSPVDV